MAEYRTKAYFFQKVKNLHKLPLKELKRKWLLLGKRRVGKTRMIQQIRDSTLTRSITSSVFLAKSFRSPSRNTSCLCSICRMWE